ncbi:hypothetical protein [Pseudoalteromonas sp. R86517]|uniref:hypothetical protein n=1 Tax=Pseudoalteromonas sp. R86517 TaxID=3093857 RepID=UPI003671BE35
MRNKINTLGNIANELAALTRLYAHFFVVLAWLHYKEMVYTPLIESLGIKGYTLLVIALYVVSLVLGYPKTKSN